MAGKNWRKGGKMMYVAMNREVKMAGRRRVRVAIED